MCRDEGGNDALASIKYLQPPPPHYHHQTIWTEAEMQKKKKKRAEKNARKQAELTFPRTEMSGSEEKIR